VSCIDFVKLATAKNANDAAEVIRNIEKKDKEYERERMGFFRKLEKYQFPGPGQTAKYVMCLSECVELLMMLPGKVAKEFRRNSAGLLTHLFAGDPTLHDLIEQNGL
jgi:hypothetical protein